ncbi:tRNA (adenosine(37)-N6)-threonylcarbamoyltransferase complex ATPase subunit type 1 TsaE [Trichloromonas acetexigens]|uniref:tRNA threonylcarbamoyladenosine biosynthesis protein TsaE n=1 Tax=Trichloromonas acetexigens TaxID=38815 RepID=A0A550JJD1_9BACT|nr:tRNA (adenosine(37)-N6)-threonylcarbamoyltransferase complex ATPase subunit type 1 TsaE [Desulfuromonas acetexigens]TRO83317.1 tRNA (adenosine(37)-N6)-threonylcarbamoyltransferase complex ATPase subunit type 1 TsaE [Desulfuromonas acetexigens]
MLSWTLETTSPERTRELGKALGRLLGPSSVVLLHGELGAGKTCFTQGLARGLEVAEDEPVTSPSYTLMNPYAGRLPLYHFDLYRLVSVEDLVDLGFDDYFHGNGVTVVEWADRFPQLVLEGLRVRLEHTADDSRRITLEADGEPYGQLLDSLRRDWTIVGDAE